MNFQEPARRPAAIAWLVAPLILLLPVSVIAADKPAVDQAARLEFFEKKIRPVLVLNCYECHSVLSKEPKGELLLDSRERMRRGGESGPAVVPGNLEKSLILSALKHESLEMPPKKKLPAAVVSDF
ncbi:MAG: c-type cytochrome domain-containing protein, partial [Pirellulaceae bacterium]